MKNDSYQEARVIADSLEKIGLDEQAAQIRRALAEGATGTEIYMILRWRLAGLIQEIAIPAELKDQMRSLHDYLDRALGT